MRNCYFGKKTMKGKDEILYEQPGWNANLDGAILDGAIHLYDEVIIIYKITPKKLILKKLLLNKVLLKKLLQRNY